MKKTLKLLAVVALLLIMLVGLTGCGNKIVATKESEEMGVTYEEKLEIKLKKDKIDTVKVTMTFDDKDTAEAMKNSIRYCNGNDDCIWWRRLRHGSKTKW